MSSEPTIPNLEIKILKLCWHKPIGKSEECYDVVKAHLRNRFDIVLLSSLIAW